MNKFLLHNTSYFFIFNKKIDCYYGVFLLEKRCMSYVVHGHNEFDERRILKLYFFFETDFLIGHLS